MKFTTRVVLLLLTGMVVSLLSESNGRSGNTLEDVVSHVRSYLSRGVDKAPVSPVKLAK